MPLRPTTTHLPLQRGNADAFVRPCTVTWMMALHNWRRLTVTSERMSLSARSPQWLLAALSFVVVACLGGAGSLWVVMHLQHQAGQAASAQTQAFASSVARTLAGQFEHAVNHGAPLKQIPRVEVYLAKMQHSTPRREPDHAQR